MVAICNYLRNLKCANSQAYAFTELGVFQAASVLLAM